MFHSWGFAHFSIGLIIGSTFVLRRKFDPEECLAEIARHRCDSLVVVPVMMQRILELPEETRRRYDLSSLKVVAASGSALPGDLATNWMDATGDNLYNLYGSTEVAWATIATPQDMRAAPGTAGKAARGTVVKLYDATAERSPQGETGRIFVGNEMLFEGYTGGGTKDVIDELMATGDVGRFDRESRLFVEGRDDEMIVSGGENVFPKEVEDLLSRHEAVAEAAAHRRRRPRLRSAAASFRRAREGRRRDRGRAQGLREVQPRSLQGAARDRLPRRAAAQRDRQGPQAHAARARGRGNRLVVAPEPGCSEVAGPSCGYPQGRESSRTEEG